MNLKNIGIVVLLSTQVWGSGYEKTILWGGKYAGVGSAASAGIKGSDSIFYNPAGLINSGEFGELVFNLSQSTSQFKGPIVPNASVVNPGPTVSAFTNAEKQETSKTNSSWIPGITYSMKVSDDWAFGLGYYAVGGTRANYEDVDFLPRDFKAKVGSEITITELSAGVAYRASDDLRFGLGLRYTMTSAKLSSVGYSQSASGAITAISNVDINDINVSKLDSVRLGVQYDLSQDTKLGLTLRTDTKVDGTGKASGVANACSSATCAAVVNLPISEVDAKVDTEFPMAVNLGIETNVSPEWTLFGEYVFTQYSKIDKVVIDGTITVGTTAVEISDIDQKWKDQHNIKLAAEYKGFSWPIRYGFVWTSQVSDKDYARASFTPPGAAYTYTLGTGKELISGESPLEFNISMDYTTVSGDSSESSPQPLSTPKGTYQASAVGIHSGISYRF